jgi:hypothetical protein
MGRLFCVNRAPRPQFGMVFTKLVDFTSGYTDALIFEGGAKSVPCGGKIKSAPSLFANQKESYYE